MFVVHVSFWSLVRVGFAVCVILAVMHDKFGWWL